MKTRLLFLFAVLFLSLNSYSQERKLSAEETSRYENLMKEGEIWLAKQDLTGAKKKFIEACVINPYASLPKEKIKAIDEKLLKIQQNELKVNNLTKEGDAFFANKQFSEAKAKFNEALKIQPGNMYAANKIAEIDAILKQK